MGKQLFQTNNQNWMNFLLLLFIHFIPFCARRFQVRPWNHAFFVRKQQHCLQIFKKHFQMNYSVGVRDGFTLLCLMICIWRVNHVPDPVLPGPAMPFVNQERLVLNFWFSPNAKTTCNSLSKLDPRDLHSLSERIKASHTYYENHQSLNIFFPPMSITTIITIAAGSHHRETSL